ncbi:hypothetical protein [Armatimonas sp.]|uniref:hypothetical protein n=1 Tax=Armatimonas sp. TaxID=1872638 RepID=UPI003752D643
MSRYLELSVDGTVERVGERALRAFRRIGKVEQHDLPAALIAGIIKVDGEPASVQISWKPGREGRVRIEIAANSYDTLSQAADSALYTYASAYKAAGWPDPERDRRERQQNLLRISGGFLALLLLATLIYLLIGTAAQQERIR